MHVAEAEGFVSIAQGAHVSSYPLEGDDPYECSRETEHQAEEPEDIHADTGTRLLEILFKNPFQVSTILLVRVSVALLSLICCREITLSID